MRKGRRQLQTARILLRQELLPPPNAPFFLPTSRCSPSSPDTLYFKSLSPYSDTRLLRCGKLATRRSPSLKQRGAAEHPNASPRRGRDCTRLEPKAETVLIGAPFHPIWAWACPSGRRQDVTNALCPSGAGSAGASSCLTQHCPAPTPPTSGRGRPSSPPAAPGARVPGLYKESFVWVGNNCSPLYGNMGCVS